MYGLTYRQQLALTHLAVSVFGDENFSRVETHITVAGSSPVATVRLGHKVHTYQWTNETWLFLSQSGDPKEIKTIHIQVLGEAAVGKNTLMYLILETLLAKKFESVQVEWGDTNEEMTARNHDQKLEAIKGHRILVSQVQTPKNPPSDGPFLTPLGPGLPPNKHSVLNRMTPVPAEEISMYELSLPEPITKALTEATQPPNGE
jgi:hypothetical protein